MKHIQVTLPSEGEMREAISARDKAYIGSFFYGVVTTGVLCLPSCAARPARPENIRFFYDITQAMDAGFRPCKRCKPIETLKIRDQIIDTARFIQDNASEKLTLDNLSERLNIGPHQFQKLFKVTFGVSPKNYQDAVRLQLFKNSLQDGKKVADSIFDAGFGSTSRIYGQVMRNIGMTPSVYRAGAEGETIYYACREIEFGRLMMAATEKGVCFAQFGKSCSGLYEQLHSEFPHASLTASAAHSSETLNNWIDALGKHLDQNAPRPDLPLDLRGTAFQIKVWRYLLRVSEGDVISYSELAAGIDRPKAVRAAASACGANRIAVLVPCHRVLRGDGGLGGYRWGVEQKRALLDAERARKAAIK